MLSGFLFVATAILVAGASQNDEGSCEDKATNCRDFSTYECLTYRTWAENDCAKTCGVCGTKPDTKKPEPCDEGWNHYRGDETCMHLFGLASSVKEVSWNEARGNCKYLDGDLVIIRDIYKQRFIQKMLPSGREMWIGLRNVGPDGKKFQFKYADGTYLGNFHPWNPHNPDYYQNQERCVTLGTLYLEKLSGWNDLNCKERRPFMCEKKAIVA